MTNDPLGLDKPAASQRRRTRPPELATGLEEIDTAAAQQATQASTIAGSYRRKTITLLPGQIKLIAQIAKQNNYGILSFYRWLISEGLMSYEAGQRPEVAAATYEIISRHESGRAGEK